MQITTTKNISLHCYIGACLRSRAPFRMAFAARAAVWVLKVEGSQSWLNTTLESLWRRGKGLESFCLVSPSLYNIRGTIWVFSSFLILGQGTKLGSVVRYGSQKPCREHSQYAVLLWVSSKDPKWPPCRQHTQLQETAKFTWEGSGMWNNGCDLKAFVFVLEVKRNSLIHGLFFFD